MLGIRNALYLVGDFLKGPQKPTPTAAYFRVARRRLVETLPGWFNKGDFSLNAPGLSDAMGLFSRFMVYFPVAFMSAIYQKISYA